MIKDFKKKILAHGSILWKNFIFLNYVMILIVNVTRAFCSLLRLGMNGSLEHFPCECNTVRTLEVAAFCLTLLKQCSLLWYFMLWNEFFFYHIQIAELVTVCIMCNCLFIASVCGSILNKHFLSPFDLWKGK